MTTWTDLIKAWDELGEVAVQGNLDPELLVGPWEPIEAAARHLLETAGRRPGYIFNLGHGISQFTDPDKVSVLVEAVHSQSRALRT